MTEIEVWTKWESQIVNGLFPLRRFLGRSDHSVVFLTDCRARSLSKAAIKLIPADPAVAEIQLSHWKRIATLSHPHLVRVLDSGRCELGGHPFLFIVMEYAEQTLAQILPHRALTFDEVREMLIPALSALAYLHRKNLLQCQLKPPNFLVVNDQLKLASDTLRPLGDPVASIAKASRYDPPEAKNGAIDAAGDVWGLGITMVEALTQLPPGPDQGSGADSLPANLPPEFVDTVRRCLNRDPAARPLISELETQFNHAPSAPAQSIPQSAILEAPRQNPPQIPKTRLLIPAIAVSLIVLVAIWAGMRPFRNHSNATPLASSAAQTASQPPSSPIVASQNQAMPMSAAGSALHQEIPVLSRGARDSIHGQIKVTVLVTVDHSGAVIAESLENRGSSKYFARLATEAAKKWRFAPADNRDSRQWLLQFEFTRSGATGLAVAHGPNGPRT